VRAEPSGGARRLRGGMGALRPRPWPVGTGGAAGGRPPREGERRSRFGAGRGPSLQESAALPPVSLAGRGGPARASLCSLLVFVRSVPVAVCPASAGPRRVCARYALWRSAALPRPSGAAPVRTSRVGGAEPSGGARRLGRCFVPFFLWLHLFKFRFSASVWWWILVRTGAAAGGRPPREGERRSRFGAGRGPSLQDSATLPPVSLAGRGGSARASLCFSSARFRSFRSRGGVPRFRRPSEGLCALRLVVGRGASAAVGGGPCAHFEGQRRRAFGRSAAPRPLFCPLLSLVASFRFSASLWWGCLAFFFFIGGRPAPSSRHGGA